MGLDRVGKQELTVPCQVLTIKSQIQKTKVWESGGSYPHELLYLVFRGRE